MEVSIWLGSDNTRRKIKCIFCGKTVNEVTGEVVQIIAGNVQSERPAKAVITQCRGCKSQYIWMD